MVKCNLAMTRKFASPSNVIYLPALLASWVLLIHVGTPSATAQVKLPDKPVPKLASTVAGIIERAVFPQLGIEVNAKLDTGARSSSINAANLFVIDKDGKKHVQFEVRAASGKVVTVVRPLHRFVMIRRAGVKTVRRPAVLLKVCVGGQSATTLFTLANRGHLRYEALIGRRFLRGRLLVASGDVFLLAGKCAKL